MLLELVFGAMTTPTSITFTLFTLGSFRLLLLASLRLCLSFTLSFGVHSLLSMVKELLVIDATIGHWQLRIVVKGLLHHHGVDVQCSLVRVSKLHVMLGHKRLRISLEDGWLGQWATLVVVQLLVILGLHTHFFFHYYTFMIIL